MATQSGEKKRKTVLVGGTFEIVHPGHIYFLNKAKEFGNYLVVVVARDSTVRKMKRPPVVPEDQRLKVIASLKPVDSALLGKEQEDIIEIVKEIKPDVIVLGPDQAHDIKDLQSRISASGLRIDIKKIENREKKPLYSVKEIIRKIKES